MGHQDRITVGVAPLVNLGASVTQSGGQDDSGGAQKMSQRRLKRGTGRLVVTNIRFNRVAVLPMHCMVKAKTTSLRLRRWPMPYLERDTGYCNCHYWYFTVTELVQTLQGHLGALTDCCFHPAGSYIITSGVDLLAFLGC